MKTRNGVIGAMFAGTVALMPTATSAKPIVVDAIVELPMACDSMATLVKLSEIALQHLDEESPESSESSEIRRSRCFDIEPKTGMRELSRNGYYVEIELFTYANDHWKKIGVFWTFAYGFDHWLIKKRIGQ